PVASRYTYLRTSLRAGLLETFAQNRPLVEGGLRLFEIGFEYLPVEGDLPHERPMLCAVVGGEREGRWARPTTAERLDFYDAKGALEAIFEELGVEAEFAASSGFGLLEGHSASIRGGGRELGVRDPRAPD